MGEETTVEEQEAQNVLDAQEDLMSEVSDEDISGMTFDEFAAKAAENQADPGDAGAGDIPAGDEDGDEEDSKGDADGAAADDGSSEPEADPGSTSDDEGTAEDNSQAASDESDEASKDDQSKDKGEADPSKDSEKSSVVNFEEEYKKLMAPFKAAKRMVTVDNIDDARALMQKGVDYSRKLEIMKPNMRILRSLEKNGLLTQEKINFFIDLEKKNPDAIKKLLQDSSIDPMDIDLKEKADYLPTDHGVGDTEVAIKDVLDGIKDSPKYQDTLDLITEGFDQASRVALRDDPKWIATLNEHMEAGIFQTVMDKVADERLYGRLSGLSDLDAYYAVGDAMHKAGAFTEANPNAASSTTLGTPKASAQGSGSRDNKSELRNRRRAAGATKGGAGSGKKPPKNILAMDDADIEKMDISSLNL